MSGHDDLTLHEKLMLLALHDDTGKVISGTNITYGLGGAILADLLLDEAIRVVKPKKTPLAEARQARSMDNRLLEECRKKIRDAKRRASLQTWVGRFVGVKQLKHRIALGLVDRGILRADEESILLMFKRRIYPERDPGPEQRIRERVREAIYGNEREIDPRTVTLISLAHHSGVLAKVFGKKEMKARKTRIESIMNGDLSGKATQEAIEAMQAAVMVAVILPTIMTTTIHN